MIESEEQWIRVTDIITRWAKFTKAKFMLRQGDIESLTRQIIDEFYRVHLSCGHRVREIDEGIDLEFKDHDNGEEVTVVGSYCRDCAEDYKKTLGAKELGV